MHMRSQLIGVHCIPIQNSSLRAIAEVC